MIKRRAARHSLRMYDVSGVDLPHPVSLFGIQHEHDAMIDPWTREFFLSGSGYRQIPDRDRPI